MKIGNLIRTHTNKLGIIVKLSHSFNGTDVFSVMLCDGSISLYCDFSIEVIGERR